MAPLNDPMRKEASRQAIRLAGDFLLNSVRLITEALRTDLVSAVTFMAITRANVAELARDTRRDAAYSGLGQVPPDDQRKAVSIYAVARELKLPYETARRHVKKLADAGLCERVEAGIIIPARVFEGPVAVAVAERSARNATAFIDALAQCGVRAGGGVVVDEDHRNQVARRTTSYFLNSIALLNGVFDFDLVNGLVLLAIVRANTWGITTNPGLAHAYAALETVPPDDLRRPVSVYALSRDLKLPYETARRYVQKLLDHDLCERAEAGGLIVPARVFLRPEFMAVTRANWEETCRYVADLAQIGVVPQAA